MLELFHGSNQKGIKILEPRLADCARLGIEPCKVFDCIEIDNAYDLFQDYILQGKMIVGKSEEKSKKEMQMWYHMILDYLKEKEMIKMPECSYARFVKCKFPFVWEKYEKEIFLYK